MIDLIKKIFGLGPKVDIAEVLKKGAIIIDVRTPGEYSSGHVKGSINIPLNNLESNLNKIRQKDKPIVTCCASGMRSGAAKSILKSRGYEVYNGGSWMSVKNKLK